MFNENLIAIQNNVPSVKFNKPIYLGMCILDFSKLLMYQFYYEKINVLWPDNEVLYQDTDAFILNIHTEDVYKDMEKIIDRPNGSWTLFDDLDTSAYPLDHPLYSNKNKKVIGKFKDELNGDIMTEAALLRSKSYSFLSNKFSLQSTGEALSTGKALPKEKIGEVKKLKGITRTSVNKNITFDDYKNAIIEPYTKVNYTKMHILGSKKHEMYLKEINKKSISPYDDKRYLLNSIETLPHCDKKTKEDIMLYRFAENIVIKFLMKLKKS